MYDGRIEAAPREELRTLQDHRLKQLVARLSERVPFYTTLLKEAGLDQGLISGTSDLPELPMTRKEHLRDNYPFGLLAIDRNRLARVHASSGTTGKPVIAAYSHSDLETFSEVNARSLEAAGARPGMMLHNAYGYGLFTGGLGIHGGGERLGLNVVPVSGGVTDRQILLIEDLRPDVIACTPSYAQTLSEQFGRRGVDPDSISLRFAVLGAEPWSRSIREDVDSGLGVRSTNIYGLSEIIGPGVSQECLEERDGSHIWEDHFLPEIVDPTSGKVLSCGSTGVLVLTTLTKEAMPLLRFWTGDLTALDRTPCSCGRTHVRMKSIQGRNDDMIIVRGVNLYPSRLEEILGGIEGLAPHYQLVVSRKGTLDDLEVRVEVVQEMSHLLRPRRKGPGPDDTADGPEDRRPATPEEGARSREASTEASTEAATIKALRDRVSKEIRESIGLRLQVTLLAPGEVPRSSGGKLSRTLDLRSQDGSG